MHFFTIFTVLATAATVLAGNSCDKSTFKGATSSASPLIKDCQRLAHNIRRGGEWEIGQFFGGHRKIASYRTCAFGVQAKGLDNWLELVRVGNEDVRDLIRDSIAKFGNTKTGKVGASGVMRCQALIRDKTRNTAEWGIYHN